MFIYDLINDPLIYIILFLGPIVKHNRTYIGVKCYYFM